MKNYVLSLLVFLCLMGGFWVVFSEASERSIKEGAATLEDAIRRGAVQCYAIEGRYPASVEYLTENYGIQIDTEKYAVFYEGFASNIMPDITVVLK